MSFLGLGDVGFFRKKNESINSDSRDFRTTLGNAKHYGAKFVDCLGIAAGICFIVPLVISVFNKDDGGNNNRNQQGKTRKR